MAFTSAITKRAVMGSYKVAWGTFTSAGGSTGGNIDTGLTLVHSIQLTTSGASAVADSTSVNETLPADGSAITIVSTANATGYWFAVGK